MPAASKPVAIEPILLTDRAVGSLLGLSRSSVWEWTRKGKLPRPIKLGSCTRWRREDIENFVAALAH